MFFTRLRRDLVFFYSDERALPVDDEKRFYEAVEQSRADVLRCYPQASDPKDILCVKSAELWKKMEAENNSLVNQADAPFIVFSMVATMLEIKPVMPR